jgi:enamine deaminase RidA (YjgF/YER057c/UK114 family)
MSLDGSCFVGEGNPASQAHQAMLNVKELLALAGGDLSDICKVTTYVKDPTVRSMVYPVIAKHLQGVCPVSTGVVAKALPFEICDFQIDVFAQIAQNRNVGHERFRISDPNYLPGLDYPLSKVVLAGNVLFLQGQTGIDLSGKGFVGKGDPVVQAEKAMQNVEQLLSEAGSDLNDICKVTTYIPDHSHRKLIYPVIGQYLKGVHPTSTGIVPMALANPEVDFEIDVFAVRSL